MARTILALGILLLVQQQAHAATNELTTQLQKPKRYQLTITAQTESNLYQNDAREYESKGKLIIAPSYKINQNYRAALSASLLQDFEGGQESLLSNTKATVTHLPIQLTQDSSLIPLAGVRLPTNVKDRKKNSYNGALLAEASLITNWTAWEIPFSTVYAVYLNKNLHTYDRGASGKANTDYSMTQYFGVEKYLTPKLSILIDGDYTYARTYQNSLRTLFSLGQSVSYEFNKDLSVTIGHSNGGDALKANGTDYDISVFDANQSVVYGNIRAVY